jgi:hypothetical protein
MTGRILLPLGLATILVMSHQSWSQQTFTGFADGNALLASCTGDESAQRFCAGYVAGVEEVLIGGNAVNGFRGCFPADVGPISRHVIDVVIAYLRNHPQLQHLPAAGLVAAAVTYAYPCK